MSQKDKILELLRERGMRGVHSYEGYQMFMPRIAAVINILKKEGHNITAKPDDGRFAPHGKHGVIYVLQEGDQGRLLWDFPKKLPKRK